MTRRLFIVRHGNTFGPGEPLRRVGAKTDMPLVPSGTAQARTLGAWFADHGVIFTRALSGPLLRTRQTADAILAASPQPCVLEIADFLKEINHGPDENALEDDVIARIGHEALAAWDQYARAPAGWIVDPEGRIAAWRTFLAEEGDGDILLVTSNGAARFALLAIGLSLGENTLKLRTGAWGEILEQGQNSFTIAGWDQRPTQ